MFRQQRANHRSLVRMALVTAVAACASLAPAVCGAQIFDSITVVQEGSNAVVSIRFTMPIQFLRYAPLDRGDYIQVYFQFVGGGDPSVLTTQQDTGRAPPTQLVPRFDVIYRAPIGSVPRNIDIKFARPVQFTLRPTDNRTIALTIPIEAAAPGAPPPGKP